MSWIKQIVSGVALTGLTLGLLTSGKAEAISFTFEKIVDSNTPIPGGTGNFGSLVFSFPSLDNGNVAFLGGMDFAGFNEGIYTSINGVLDVVADTNTPVPGSTGNFGSFLSYSLDNGNVAFSGDSSPDFEQGGIYTSINGVLDVVADENTPIPGGTGNFGSLDFLSLDNGNVAFQGNSADFEQFGIYISINDVLDVVADRNTPIPGGTGNFGSFLPTSLDNGNVAFEGNSPDFEQEGIYTSINGVLDVVADRNTPIPGGTGNFDRFGNSSLDNGNVAFLGDSVGFEQSGIYTNIGGTLAEVIAEGDLLDGKQVSILQFGDLSGNQIAFSVLLTEPSGETASQAIYIATVPEPSSVLGTLAFGAFGGGWMLKRKLKKQKSASPIKSVN